ncbi:MAG: anthranilate phosphoribosyltransferase [Candidatus Nephthysia bennettiae]|uniref:Anthranilate phosphoribosyltransferase n=2 Tax=Candidatus Nephthysia bennettiae TaxID=3127016 RepID=A0A934JZQ7_9BACT|nr:anthranilate phosphoribosyltransferase [Candidatus Dormibacteraeota bacterium]MBJ7611716.1 anthranilate phosphoribosyltransferase [Candidatus Dormibacteraeota bacterium]PZR96727.1 MAG: anthranilate phosphoribosyltransferase [Candidatus Dormibacteraeota bacterium]
MNRLARGESLSEPQAAQAMELIMRDEATPIQIAGFITALRVKGETVDELAGLARTARALATPIHVDDAGSLLDTCGTGGDGSGSFNISTLAAIVAAACGARVAKHGNRASSSTCGSADVLEALGVRIDLAPEAVAACIREVGIGFLFAPVFHPSFRFATLPRRELGIRTVFNVLGPLCNPAGARRQALGVPEPGLAGKMAEVLDRLGVERALVFHSEGLDELSTTGPSLVIEMLDGERRSYQLDATELGLPRSAPEDLRGGGPAENADIARELLEGATGPRRDVVLLNASAALRAAGIARDWREGMALSAEALDQGRAAAVLERWVQLSKAAAA